MDKIVAKQFQDLKIKFAMCQDGSWSPTHEIAKIYKQVVFIFLAELVDDSLQGLRQACRFE